MNIIKYDTYFSPIITMDNTEITMDNTEITMDNTSSEIYGYRIELVPRKYETEIGIEIKEPIKNSVISFTASSIVDNGILIVNLEDFIPVEGVEYDVEVLNGEQKTLWYGQCMYTTKDIQNYDVSNSDENYLRF